MKKKKDPIDEQVGKDPTLDTEEAKQESDEAKVEETKERKEKPGDPGESEEKAEASEEQQEAAEGQKEEPKPVEEEDEDLKTKYLRLAADFQNYKRRVEKEKNDIYAYANEKLMAELLNVIDNFDRALAVESVDTGMKEGMEMIFKQLIDVLESCGLEEIQAEGQEFDPNCHHAVQTQSSDAHCSGQIIKVLQKGYTLNKKVIRPAMVIVAE
ncbi:MAG TPA: nucleotide exchange factor GrpE [Bacillota bacterium]|jgi:molecular chaperone GrpE|nr:nucleotide exchange factor GrpE [Clostridiales bacterium UBA9856]HOA42893.1 nucleotide exchange factor GrpE [Bacillota bacterium]HPZ60088.1 nucleotide exchange factor GrpE [Bacillota bacterium]HQC82081.1 nucleotide exchange factor GrpE [Bacillota bacterium]